MPKDPDDQKPNELIPPAHAADVLRKHVDELIEEAATNAEAQATLNKVVDVLKSKSAARIRRSYLDRKKHPVGSS